MERAQDGSCAVFLGDRQGLGPCPRSPFLHLTDAPMDSTQRVEEGTPPTSPSIQPWAPPSPSAEHKRWREMKGKAMAMGALHVCVHRRSSWLDLSEHA